VRIENTTVDKRGTWNWTIDYSPVNLGGNEFWLPATITSSNLSEGEKMVLPSGWTAQTTVRHKLVAKYSDYHLRTVKSRVITEPGPTPPMP
jgi:hypothetical protein